jgi:hypothetical protein
MSEVERVAKEPTNVPWALSRPVEQRRPNDESYDVQYPESGRIRLGFHFGGGFPVGEFGSTTEANGGAAKAGFVFGGELDYHLKYISSWITSVAVAFNGLDRNPIETATGLSADVGSWVTIWPMTGIRLSSPTGGNTSLYFQGQIGVLFGNSPEITTSSSSSPSRVTQSSSSATAFAFSLGAGFLMGKRAAIGTRYLYGVPEYQVTASSGSQSVTGKFKQPTGILLLTIGAIL